MVRKILIVYFSFVIANASQAEEFKINFSWAGLKLCTSGNPNMVPNPIFEISGLPKGTVGIDFRLKDLNVPNYNHGGGWIEISKDGAVTANSFKYKSPCPPNGKHKYQWTAKAKDKKGFGGKTLATAKASRIYPDQDFTSA